MRSQSRVFIDVTHWNSRYIICFSFSRSFHRCITLETLQHNVSAAAPTTYFSTTSANHYISNAQHYMMSCFFRAQLCLLNESRRLRRFRGLFFISVSSTVRRSNKDDCKVLSFHRSGFDVPAMGTNESPSRRLVMRHRATGAAWEIGFSKSTFGIRTDDSGFDTWNVNYTVSMPRIPTSLVDRFLHCCSKPGT